MYKLNIFLFYSIIGYLFETIISLIMNNHFDSGIMYGPWTILYGIGVLLIMFIHKCTDKFKRYKKFYFIFISIISLTLLEYITGNILEVIYNVRYWDYSNILFNIGPYISLPTSILWGILAYLVIYVFNPFIDKFIKKIPKVISIILSILFIIDFIVTIVKIFI